MQLGIFAKTFTRPSVDETFKVIASYGFQAVQFNMSTVSLAALPDKISDTEIQEIKQASEKYSISLSALSGTFNMAHPDVTHRQEELEKFAVLIEAAKRLETPVITLCTGTRDTTSMWKYHPENSSKEAWKDLCATLEPALSLAEKHELMLAFEPETSNVVSNAKKARQLLDEMKSPHLKVIMDAANLFTSETLNQQEKVFAEAFELLSSDIVLAHAKDINEQDTFVAAGKGFVNYELFVRHLKQIYFQGALVLHSLSETEVPDCNRFLQAYLSEGCAGKNEVEHTIRLALTYERKEVSQTRGSGRVALYSSWLLVSAGLR
jgi:sugar phosphate isomerase/epimerase